MRGFPILAVVLALLAGSCTANNEQEELGIRVQLLSQVGPDDHLLLNSAFALDNGGYLYAGPVATRGAVAQYTSGGSLSRLIGREGGGPGELGKVETLFGWRGDTIAVQHGRLVSLFSKGGTFGRDLTVHGLVLDVAVSGDTVAILYDQQMGPGIPAWAISSAGAEFVAVEREPSFDPELFAIWDGQMLLARKDSDQVAVVPLRGGAATREAALGLPWIGARGIEGVYMQGRLRDLAVHGDTLWVQVIRYLPRRADETEAQASGPEVSAPQPISVASRVERFEFLIAAYELPTFRQLAASRWRGRIVQEFLGGARPTLVTVGESSTGVPTAQVWLPEMRRVEQH